jgi:hypothetical protein
MLPQLISLRLSKATQLREVFRHSQGDGVMNELEIVLPNLTEITLLNLPNFVDFFVHKAETEEAVYVVEQYMAMSSRDKGKEKEIKKGIVEREVRLKQLC